MHFKLSTAGSDKEKKTERQERDKKEVGFSEVSCVCHLDTDVRIHHFQCPLT